MYRKKIKSKIRMMNEFHEFYKSTPRKRRGIPVVGQLLKTGTLIAKSDISITDKNDPDWKKLKHPRNLTHPERKLIEEIKNNKITGKFDLVVTLSPCIDCRKDIEDFNKDYNNQIKNVYYLLENTWHKKDKVDFGSLTNPSYKKIIHDSLLSNSEVSSTIEESNIHTMCEEIVLHQNDMYKVRRMQQPKSKKYNYNLIYDKKKMGAYIQEF